MRSGSLVFSLLLSKFCSEWGVLLIFGWMVSCANGAPATILFSYEGRVESSLLVRVTGMLPKTGAVCLKPDTT
jgi:hypothetical protein